MSNSGFDKNVVIQSLRKIQKHFFSFNPSSPKGSSAKNIKNSSQSSVIWAGWVKRNAILKYNEKYDSNFYADSHSNTETSTNKALPQLEGVGWVV